MPGRRCDCDPVMECQCSLLILMALPCVWGKMFSLVGNTTEVSESCGRACQQVTRTWFGGNILGVSLETFS